LRKSQFRAICRRIDRQIASPDLGPTTLARDFHITRPTLYRMFEPHGGIGRYILGRRLTGVFRDLSDPALAQKKIALVLRRWGFANHTAAGRAFRAAYGLTPSECRARACEIHRSGGISGVNAFDIPPEMPASITAFRTQTVR
jgi:AraC-like DNA-binding protein